MALTAEPKNGPVLLSPSAESGILVQPPARRPDVSLYRLGTEPVFFDRAQSMDPQARKTKCRLNTLLTPNPSCEVSGTYTRYSSIYRATSSAGSEPDRVRLLN